MSFNRSKIGEWWKHTWWWDSLVNEAVMIEKRGLVEDLEKW